MKPFNNLPKNSLHPCKECKWAQSMQGYQNVCANPNQLQKLKRGNYVEPQPETCGVSSK